MTYHELTVLKLPLQQQVANTAERHEGILLWAMEYLMVSAKTVALVLLLLGAGPTA